jgi:hypothetical protein
MTANTPDVLVMGLTVITAPANFRSPLASLKAARRRRSRSPQPRAEPWCIHVEATQLVRICRRADFPLDQTASRRIDFQVTRPRITKSLFRSEDVVLSSPT